jgi:hypothetical protein
VFKIAYAPRASNNPPGVYIAMNGKYFNWDNAKKNKEIGEFEEIDN